jgi:predicted transposase YdaD
MQLTWAERLEAKGREEGRAEGRAEERVRSLEGFRRAVLRSIEERFGEVPESVRQRVAAIQAPEPLVKLAGRVVVAESPADLFSRRRLPRN